MDGWVGVCVVSRIDFIKIPLITFEKCFMLNMIVKPVNTLLCLSVAGCISQQPNKGITVSSKIDDSPFE